ATFTLRGPTPNAVALAIRDGVLEARLPDGALRTDRFGLFRLFVRNRIEDVGVDPAARRPLTPRQVHRQVTSSYVSNAGLRPFTTASSLPALFDTHTAWVDEGSRFWSARGQKSRPFGFRH